jgi:N-acetylmuramoyl-L-alanine amidase
MDFEVHKREIHLNGLRVHLGFPIVESGGRLYLSGSDYRHQLQPLLTPQLSGDPPMLRHIVLDAGHGGKDPGTQNSDLGLREKSLTLDLARRVKQRLEAQGFRVSLTRDKDIFIQLEERARQANRLGADLFVSLHFNATSKSSVQGIETYTLTPPFQPSTSRAKLHSSDRQTYPGNVDGPWSSLLAYYMQRSLVDTLKATDRGFKRARFTVLQDLNMPGLLVEGGFVTNPNEGSNIGSSGYRDRIAQGIVEGILVYQKTLGRLSGEGS